MPDGAPRRWAERFQLLGLFFSAAGSIIFRCWFYYFPLQRTQLTISHLCKVIPLKSRGITSYNPL